MIVVRVELWSAITGEKSELARAVISNEGGTAQRGNYLARAMRGRDEAALQKNMIDVMRGAKPIHEARVENHARLSEHVWNLVAKSLTAMGYGK